MRLLLTTDTVGGVWTFTWELAGELLRRGIEVVLVSFGRMPSDAQLADIQTLSAKGDFRFVPTDIPLEWMPENEAAYTAGADQLVPLCRHFKPDALLLSQFCFGALPVQAPKVVIAHSDVLSWATAVGKAPLPPDTWLLRYKDLVQRGLDAADVVVAPTAAMLHMLQQHFAVPCPTRVVSNGRTLPLAESKSPRAMRAVSAGRMWDPAKNLAVLETIDSPMPIFVAGETAEFAPHSRLTALGVLSPAALHAFLRESAIYLCYSLYEPFGLAALEAALCECAVVANDIPSLREVWGDAALYFQSAQSLQDLLQALTKNPDQLAAAQARARARANLYSAATMVEGYLNNLRVVGVNSPLEACAA